MWASEPPRTAKHMVGAQQILTQWMMNEKVWSELRKETDCNLLRNLYFKINLCPVYILLESNCCELPLGQEKLCCVDVQCSSSVTLFFFSFIFIGWRLITLQYCSGFCHTLIWISHGFICVPHPTPPSQLPPHPLPLGLASAPALRNSSSSTVYYPRWKITLLFIRLMHRVGVISWKGQKETSLVGEVFSVLTRELTTIFQNLSNRTLKICIFYCKFYLKEKGFGDQRKWCLSQVCTPRICILRPQYI